MLLCAIGFVLALGVRPATPIALAEEGVIDNSINVTINDCVNTDIQLGQAGSDGWEDLFATDTQTGVLNSENPVMASAVATQTVTITLGDDSTEGDAMRKAIASGRMSARLKIESVNTFTTTSGSNINNVAEYKLSGALGNYPADDKSATLVQKGATANDGGDSTVVELSKSGYLTSNGLVEGDASFTKLTSNVITIVYKATTTAVAQPSGLTAPVASCNVLCDVTFSLELDFEEVKFTLNLTSGGTVSYGEEAILGGTNYIPFNTPIAAIEATPEPNYYFVGWLERGNTSYVESMSLQISGIENSVDVPVGTDIEYTAQFRSFSKTQEGYELGSGYTFSGEGRKAGPIIRDTITTEQYWVFHKYQLVDEDGNVIMNGETPAFEFSYANNAYYDDSTQLNPALYQPETIYAGTYRYTAKLYYKSKVGENVTPTEDQCIGTYSEIYKINKNTPHFQIVQDGQIVE
ncbi:MAG: hypothetical protein J6V83_00830, partial [Clostridia bacterium]|nr:hypothetical protein [Clostridia bacterium]